MTKRTYTILGIPRPQGRPRFARVGKFVKTYEAKEDTHYKENVSAQLVTQNPTYLTGPVGAHFIFYLPRPISLPKKIIHHLKKPDLTNLIKGTEDACRGILWKDDAQIVMMIITKKYGDPPRVEIEVGGFNGEM